ncbi:hypothetical protein POM88_027600 [Heracleum sosnowskyi]|uniref:Uncharacterized protein n=1 Tax=Heracleum sosnowskyi TaxID=360622 RepID=A0AAD8I892_9APIA|nr:hypothetical protein POM88_027600 [Heracleum sosnowskyi]
MWQLEPPPMFGIDAELINVEQVELILSTQEAAYNAGVAGTVSASTSLHAGHPRFLSLERKISERMKFLQAHVPGCKQSLQQEVEFLSMKLSTVNLEMDFNMEDILSKDINQSWVPLKHESSGCISSDFPLFNLHSYMMPMNSLTPIICRNLGMQHPLIDGYNTGVASHVLDM